jgi:opacity protein-like surface antigen
LVWKQLNKPERDTMKKFLLAAALSALFAAGALAEDSRDQAYGKHDMGASPDSNMNRPNSATGTQGMATSKSGTRGVPKRSKQVDK